MKTKNEITNICRSAGASTTTATAAISSSLHRIDGLSAHGAGHRARRRLAAERRAARFRSRLHAKAASRSPTVSSMACCIRCGSAATTSAIWISPQALWTAINDWQIDAWVGPEPRLRGSIYVPQDYPEAAVKEIERRAGDPRFVQVSCAPQSRASRSATAATGRCSRPRPGGQSPLALHSAAFRAIRRPARAGRPIISSTTSPMCRRCSRW